MSSSDKLKALAKAAGLDTGYWLVDGTWCDVPLRSLERMLGSLGYPAGTPEEVAASLYRLDERPWQRTLPPVLVLYSDQIPFAIPVVMSRGGAGTLTWNLTEEYGASRGATFPYSDLPLVGSRQLKSGQTVERRLFWVHDRLPLGYHTFSLTGEGLPDGRAELSLVIAPRRCYQPDAFHDPMWRCWGFAVQLYALHGSRSGGIGDFGDLRRLIEATAELGGNAIGLNPLHALFKEIPESNSPYGPSSRLYLNTLYIDIEGVPEADDPRVRAMLADPERIGERDALNREPLVDYPGVARWKTPIFEAMFAVFRERHQGEGANGERGRKFSGYRQQGGESLRLTALYEALAEHFARIPGHGPTWRQWPEAYQRPDSLEVQRFAQEKSDRVDYHTYLFWLAEEQLTEVDHLTRRLGMGIGLYADMALGVNSDGADYWRSQGDYAQGVSIGAPPDAFSPNGQDWGIPPYHPHRLKDLCYRPFIEVLRASMRHAGAIRLDHAMSLTRLFWVPHGGKASEGGYMRYPFDDLLAIVALESRRNRCLVIGEALGTLPEGFQERLDGAGVLYYRLLLFERDHRGDPQPPANYPADSAVVAATHDLPTLRGWWVGRDIDERARLGLFPTPEAEAAEREDRADFRERLLVAFTEAGLPTEGLVADPEAPVFASALIEAGYAWLASSPGRILMVQLEDIFEQPDAVNMPGTVHEHPNWRRKLIQPTDRLASHPRVREMAATMKQHRR
ncbi:MAG: 4-alpha-glucanotransferase [Magnetococcales bacterium]|nr:4-alpha-glucanotransferase [Magnetococcales bacterium]MBF0156131.1 4-alpha-glucanotransferase [Magnetococcales bacterium]